MADQKPLTPPPQDERNNPEMEAEVVLDVESEKSNRPKDENGASHNADPVPEYIYRESFLGRIEMAMLDISRALGEIIGLLMVSFSLTILPPLVWLAVVEHLGYKGWPEGVGLIWLGMGIIMLLWLMGRWFFYIRESIPGWNEIVRFLPKLHRDAEGKYHIPLTEFLKNRSRYIRLLKERGRSKKNRPAQRKSDRGND